MTAPDGGPSGGVPRGAAGDSDAVRDLPDEAFSRAGTASNHRLTVNAAACFIAGHELHHHPQHPARTICKRMSLRSLIPMFETLEDQINDSMVFSLVPERS